MLSQCEYELMVVPQPAPKPPSVLTTGAKLSVLLLLHKLIGSTVYDLYLQFVAPYIHDTSQTTYTMLGNIFIAVFSLLAILPIAAYIAKIPFKHRLKYHKKDISTGLKNFPLSVSATILMAVIVYITTNMSGFYFKSVILSAGMPTVNFQIQNPTIMAIIIQASYVILIGPFCEEILYRGIILELLSPYGKLPAIAITAFFFGFMHENIPQAAAAFAGGLVYSAVAYQTKSIVPSFIMHVLNNIYGSLYDITGAMGLHYLTTMKITMILTIIFMWSGIIAMKHRQANNAYSETKPTRKDIKYMFEFFIHPCVILYISYIVVFGYMPAFLQ